MEKVTKKTTVVGFAEALKQTLDIISKKMNEQQSQINAAHSLIDNLQRQVDNLEIALNQTMNEQDKLKNPTLFDK